MTDKQMFHNATLMNVYKIDVLHVTAESRQYVTALLSQIVMKYEFDFKHSDPQFSDT